MMSFVSYNINSECEIPNSILPVNFSVWGIKRPLSSKWIETSTIFFPPPLFQRGHFLTALVLYDPQNCFGVSQRQVLARPFQFALPSWVFQRPARWDGTPYGRKYGDTLCFSSQNPWPHFKCLAFNWIRINRKRVKFWILFPFIKKEKKSCTAL